MSTHHANREKGFDVPLVPLEAPATNSVRAGSPSSRGFWQALFFFVLPTLLSPRPPAPFPLPLLPPSPTHLSRSPAVRAVLRTKRHLPRSSNQQEVGLDSSYPPVPPRLI